MMDMLGWMTEVMDMMGVVDDGGDGHDGGCG